MYICIYVYMYICIYVYMYICIYVYMYICIYVYMYICIYMYIRIYVYMYICIYVYMYICIYVYMYICIYVYMYMYIYIYVYMYICIYVYMYEYLHKNVWWMFEVGHQYSAARRSGWASWTFGGTASASTLLGPAALEQLWGWTSGCAGTKMFRRGKAYWYYIDIILITFDIILHYIASLRMFMDVCLVCLQVYILLQYILAAL